MKIILTPTRAPTPHTVTVWHFGMQIKTWCHQVIVHKIERKHFLILLTFLPGLFWFPIFVYLRSEWKFGQITKPIANHFRIRHITWVYIQSYIKYDIFNLRFWQGFLKYCDKFWLWNQIAQVTHNYQTLHLGFATMLSVSLHWKAFWKSSVFLKVAKTRTMAGGWTSTRSWLTKDWIVFVSHHPLA